MGAVSAALARSFGTVLSFDAVFERARFWQIRRSQEQLANVFVFAWDGKGRPPLKAGRFDAVVMNGVLEWIPSSIMEGPPRSLQLEVLRNVCRCLRPGGRLYLAIENRFAGRYWVGHRDHHSGLRFVTVLPRPLADLYSLLVKRTPYRVHTYSLPAYRRLLSEAGFSRIHFYNAYPSYMFPKKMIPCHEERRLREAHSEKNDFESFVVRSLSQLGLGKYFVFSYGIVASRG
jgi:SAM-dependent methyltransferase